MSRSRGFKEWEKLPPIGQQHKEGKQGRFQRLRDRQAQIQTEARRCAPSLAALHSSGLRWMPYAEFLRSEYWQRIRAKLKVTANFKCACGSTRRLQIHHTTYAIRGVEHENLDKLQVLCDRCHRKAHGLP